MTVEVEGVTQQVVVAADGTWTAVFDPANLPSGEYDATITATTVDGAGNTSSTSGTIRIDTLVQNFAMSGTPGGADGVINADEVSAGFTMSGTVEPGSTVTLDFEGTTINATVAADGSWSASFTGAQIPAGTYTGNVVATATDAAGNVSTVSQSVSVDTEADNLSINASTIEGDGTVNADEMADGIRITGTATPGATVEVTLEGISQTVMAGSDGSWAATYSASDLPAGQYDASVTATTTDAAGNSNTTSATLHVDTFVDNFAVTSQHGGADSVINQAEAQAGLVVSGTTEPGSTVVIDLNGQIVNADVATDGSWTASFSAGQIAAGTYTAALVATATDAAGNVQVINDTVAVDTDAGQLTLNAGQIGGDGTINEDEAAAGVLVTGTADPGAVVEVALGGVTHNAVANGSGQWQTTYANAEITPGTYAADVSAQVTDAAGNSRKIQTRKVQVIDLGVDLNRCVN